MKTKKFTTEIAKLYWALINALPYYRGSASLIDVLVKSLYLQNGLSIPIYPFRLDYRALSMSEAQFENSIITWL